MSYHGDITLTSAIIVLSLASGALDAAKHEFPDVAEGEYIILLKHGVSDNLDVLVSDAGGQLERVVPEVDMAVATSAAEDFAEKLNKDPVVQRAIPDVSLKWIPDVNEVDVEGITPEDEPFYRFQWNMRVIEAPQVWDAGYTGKGARVADLDTGITLIHPDLAPNIDVTASRSFVPDEPTIDDYHSHGTWTAGIIAAVDDEFGVIGVAPEATLVAVKVVSGSGSGKLSWLAEGIVYAATEGEADVINMSLSAYFPKSGLHNEWRPAKESAYYLSLLNKAVNFAAQQGVTVVCSAGNDEINLNHDRDWVLLPAEAGNVIAVSATGPLSQTEFDTPAFYTNYGTSVITVAAPGGNIDRKPHLPPGWWLDMIISTTPWSWSWRCGTSASAPHVSGIAALIIGQHGGEMHPAQVKAIIRKAADDLGKPGMDDFCGHGRVNARKSLDLSAVLLTEPDCFAPCREDYDEWVDVGKPACWCHPAQCHGDADGLTGGSAKTGLYRVGPADLNLLISGWLMKEPPHGPGIASVPDGICADFAHNQGGSAKTGQYRVGPSDLNILISNWLVKEEPHGPGVNPDCLTCP